MSKDGAKGKMITSNAMGMGAGILATECWKAQVLKEQTIKDEWRKKFAPQLDDLEDTMTQRWNDRLNESKKQTDGIDPAVRSVLYDGVSKDGTGRAAYLKLRNKANPQAKQQQPLTSSQVLGWQCSTLPPVAVGKHGVTSFGRKPVVKNGFFRKGGVFTRD